MLGKKVASVAQNTILPSMAKGILSNRALDILNRASQINSEIDFCSQGGGLNRKMRNFMEWLGDHLRSELQREAKAETERVYGPLRIWRYGSCVSHLEDHPRSGVPHGIGL